MIDIGELRGLVSIKDEFSGPLSSLTSKLGLSSGSLGAMAGAAGLAAGAIAATTATIVALGQRGADVNDVQGAFNDLSKAIGSTGNQMLGALQQGTRNTIDNFTLMQTANKGLAAGVIRTSDDMKTLGSAAMVLADRTGGDAKQALEELSSALTTGRTRALAHYGVLVDSKQAVEDWALSHGRAKDSLSDVEQKQIAAAATLAELRRQLEAAGPQTNDFADNINVARTAVTNWKDALASAIASSPVVQAGMKAIGEATLGAFGKNQEERIQAIMGYVNKFAIGLTYGADVAITAAQTIHAGWNALKLIFSGVASVAVGSLEVMSKGLANFMEGLAALPLASQGVKNAAASVRDVANQFEGMRKSFVEQTKETLANGDAIDQTYGKMRAAVGNVRAAMIAAGNETVKVNETVKENTTVTNQAAEALGGMTNAQREQLKASEKAREEDKKRAEDLKKITSEIMVGMSVLSDSEFAQKFGSQIKGLEIDLKLMGQTGGDAFEVVRAAADRLRRIEMKDWVAEVEQGFREFQAVGQAAAQAAVDAEMKVGDAFIKNAQVVKQARIELAESNRETAVETAKFEIDLLKARGAKAVEIQQKELELSALVRDQAIAAEREKFLAATEGMDKTSSGYQALRDAYLARVDEMTDGWNRAQIVQQESAKKTAGDFMTGLDSMVGAFEQLANIGGESTAKIARGVGGFLGAIKVAREGVDNLLDGIQNTFSGKGLSSMLGGIGSMVAGVGSIVGAISTAIGLFGALSDKLKGGEEGMIVNPARDKFSEALRIRFGGSSNFEGLVNALAAANVTGAQAEFLIRQLQQADSVDLWKSAQDAFVNALERGGVSGVDKYHTGAKVPGTGEVPAVLLGGERVLSRAQNTDYEMGGSVAVVSAIDGLRSEMTAVMEMQERRIRAMLDEQAILLPRAIAAAQALA